MNDYINNLGIMGGTFDPIHLGHLQCAQVVADKFNLDKVLFMPANIPNFKQDNKIASGLDRYKMCELAIKDFADARFGASAFELDRNGVTYTSDTLKLFRAEFPQVKNLYFICGSDSAYTIKNWHNYMEIFENAKLVSVGRKGVSFDSQKQDTLKAEFGDRIHFIQADVIDASSSHIRQMVHKNNDVGSYLTKSVFLYIQQNNLYA